MRSPHVGHEQKIICHLRLAPRGSSWPWGRENRLGLRSSGTLKAISEYLDLIWLAITKILWAVLLKDWAIISIIQISMCSLNSVLQSGYSCLFQFNTTTVYLELPRKRVLWWFREIYKLIITLGLWMPECTGPWSGTKENTVAICAHPWNSQEKSATGNSHDSSVLTAQYLNSPLLSLVKKFPHYHRIFIELSFCVSAHWSEGIKK